MSPVNLTAIKLLIVIIITSVFHLYAMGNIKNGYEKDKIDASQAIKNLSTLLENHQYSGNEIHLRSNVYQRSKLKAEIRNLYQ